MFIRVDESLGSCLKWTPWWWHYHVYVFSTTITFVHETFCSLAKDNHVIWSVGVKDVPSISQIKYRHIHESPKYFQGVYQKLATSLSCALKSSINCLQWHAKTWRFGLKFLRGHRSSPEFHMKLPISFSPSKRNLEGRPKCNKTKTFDENICFKMQEHRIISQEFPSGTSLFWVP